MATTYKNYTFLEGTTDTNLYGKLELRLTIEEGGWDGEKGGSTVTADLYFIGKDLNGVSEDADYNKLELYTNGGLFPIYHKRDGVIYRHGDYTSADGASNFVTTTEDYTSSNLSDTDQTFNESYVITFRKDEEYEVHIHSSSFIVYHELDGSCRLYFGIPSSGIYDYIDTDARTTYTTETESMYIDLPKIEKAIVPVMADNFTDEGDPAFTYEAATGNSKVYYINRNGDLTSSWEADTIVSLQAGLSFDGETMDITYRDIPVDSTNYAFDLTEEERDLLRQKAQGSNVVPIYYMTKIVRNVYKFYENPDIFEDDSEYTETLEFVSKTQRNLTIVGCEPILNPTVKDIHARANYLTGSDSKFIKYVSIAEFETGATASKYATIVNQQVINGTHTVNNLSSGTIEGVDSNTFYFSVTDSRNLTARDAIVVDLVPYIKLTARISEADLGTDGALTFTVTGNCYNGSFGAVDNSLELEYSLRVNNEDITWHIAEGINPSFNGNTYTITHRVEGFTYRDSIVLTVNIIDEITSVQTNPKAITSIPVFDWSETDFRHRTDVFLERGKKLKTYDIDDYELDLLAIDENTNDVTFGIETTNTTIQGNTINLVSDNPITLNGTTIGANKVLWSGASHMNANQSINLSEAISEQTNGIVLVFSLYRNSAAEDVSINSFFVSKKQIELLEGCPHSFFMLVNAGFSIIGAKYLYINDSSISGHEGNTSSGANSGITFNNSNYVLRYVIGV